MYDEKHELVGRIELYWLNHLQHYRPERKEKRMVIHTKKKNVENICGVDDVKRSASSLPTFTTTA